MRKLILGLLFCGIGFGQTSGANVINILVRPTSSITSGVTVITSSAIQNIGQTSHQAVITVVNSGTSLTMDYGQIEGSADGVTWFSIGPVTTIVPTAGGATTNILLSGYRAYPFIRVKCQFNFVAGTVTVAILYIGNSSPSLVLDDTLGSISNLTTNGAAFLNSASFVSLASVGANQKITLYGLTLNAPSTGTLFTLQCSSDGSTLHGTPLVIATYGAITNLVWPVSLRPYFQCGTAGDGLYYKFTGTGGFNLSLSTRGE